MKKILFLTLLSLTCFTASAEIPWKAIWISHGKLQGFDNDWASFRKTVNIKEVPSKAIARIAADSKYWLWINGELAVFEGSLKRGPAPGECYYDEIDIAPFLKEGDNTIALEVWYFGKNGFSHASSGKLGMIFDCQSDGLEILSDRTWSVERDPAYSNTGAPHPNYRLPESNIRYDARIANPDWYKPEVKEYKPRAIMAGDANEAPFGKLVKRPIPLWKDYGMKDYVEVTTIGDTLFCKLPYNAQFTPWFEVEATNAGDTIHLLTDNYYTGYGVISPSVRAEYITKEGVQEYENLGWMSGHIMKYVIPEGVKVRSVKFRETGYDTEFAGSFTSNDPFMNELWKRAARTLYVNMRDTYFDCPERERAQWWGDVVNMEAQVFYALDPKSHLLTRKAILELVNWQRADGVMYAPIPAGNWYTELPMQILAAVGWYGFYTHYLYSGDGSFIPEIYDNVDKYLHDVWEMDDNGLVKYRLGEWAWGDWGPNQDMYLMTNCWYYMALKAQKEYAQLINRTEDIAKIEKKMKSIENAFDKYFWTGTEYRSPDYQKPTDERGNALAVLAGLASSDKYPAILNVMKEQYNAGPYMERFVLEALFEINEPEAAQKRIKDRYASMLSSDYTTLYEVWEYMDTPNNFNSNNHAWAGGPLTMMSQNMGGVQPTSPGFRTFRIAPQMGDLTEAETVVPSASGNIAVKVVRKGDNLTVTTTVPEGTLAEVVFPSGKTTPLSAGTHTVRGK